MTKARVRFQPADIEVDVPLGTTLYEAALLAGVDVSVPCGGVGLCRGCRVVATGELSEVDSREAAALSGGELARGVRLACVAAARGAVTVETGTPARIRVSEPVLPGARGAPPAIAVDLGTTTITAALIDRETGDEISLASVSNPQASLGADVMSRIAAATPGTTMQRLAAEAVGKLVARLLGTYSIDGPVELAVSGNTTMLHLLAGEDPSGLGTAPYSPVFLEERNLEPDAVGCEAAQVSRVTLLPGISAFLGADVVAGLLSTRLADREGSILLIDVGTNGEMVLKTADGHLLAASAAAGPAFEGASISHGMRAESGAIERVWLEQGDLAWRVIDDAVPSGICGSGMVDLLATLVEEGAVDANGLVADSLPGPLGGRLDSVDGVRLVRLSGDIVLTQHDVRSLQLAKGAIAAATGLLVEDAGLSEADVDSVLLAGNFGRHLDPSALAAIGLLPKRWQARTTFVGNASLAGTARWLTDPVAREEASDLAGRPRVLELAGDARFRERFVAALGFPSGVVRGETE